MSRQSRCARLARLLLWVGHPVEQYRRIQDRRTTVNYTHYDYLDLAPGASTARIEAAYAAVLERFQYGATEAGQDLSGLVRMIHAAYEVLSHPELRRSYDDKLAHEAADADAELKAMLDALPAGPSRRVQDVPAPLRNVFQALAA
jgi:DnaJ-class molecular chaperone